eukprot:9241556-Alexandrium_andersonii.AAC.2
MPCAADAAEECPLKVGGAATPAWVRSHKRANNGFASAGDWASRRPLLRPGAERGRPLRGRGAVVCRGRGTQAARRSTTAFRGDRQPPNRDYPPPVMCSR